MKYLSLLRSLFVFACALATAEAGELRLAHIFQDHMVLQREIPSPVWGWAAPGAPVEVSFAGKSASAVAGDDGYWIAKLEGLEASGEGETLTVSSGGQKIERTDVVVGEVWFCAGQSNMARSVAIECKPMPLVAQRIGDGDLPQVRFIRYKPEPSREPLADRPGDPAIWTPMTEQTFPTSMAIPFFFARQLHESLGVPVGLVEVAVSGTTQTAWTPREVIDRMHADGVCKLDFEDWKKRGKSKADAVGKNEPCVLYNSQIHPFIPFGMRGLIWHQGEGGPSEQHAERMVAMVKRWRELFGHDFVYLWGGLSRDTSKPPPLAPVTAIFYRHAMNLKFLDAQQLFGQDSRAAFVDFYDLGNTDTHWCEKDKAGERFAKAALTLAYNQPEVFTGPQKIDEKTEPGSVTVTFDRVGSGLVYQPSIGGISGFVLADGDESKWIEPRVEGTDKLVFEDPSISANSRIFYGFRANPHETLFNREGYAASTFATTGSGPSAARDGEEPVALVTFAEKSEPEAGLSILHVRRNVVVVAVVGGRGKGKVTGENTIRFEVPEEWSGVTVELNGQPVVTTDSRAETDGRRSVEFKATPHQWSYVIFNSGKEPEARKELDLTRS